MKDGKANSQSPNKSLIRKSKHSTLTKRELKIVFCGDSATGKTSIIMRLIGAEISGVKNTISLDFIRKDFIQGNSRYSIQLWDTPCQDNFKNLLKLHFMDANIVIIVIDISEGSVADKISKVNK